eukprot:CAMPEP_0118934776 /NCGR_PEP_ID=MMETSP1169-20130426/14116_1 /TAXON_ID=36882 /ORGANISM="Pyramimonas obovata, Strain CCMP722" /LENGTH=305 /DNA_ID=CAMNT_0006877713 /DNA_START=78 /DNA_END=995 /DNA_ORIENTATION=+
MSALARKSTLPFSGFLVVLLLIFLFALSVRNDGSSENPALPNSSSAVKEAAGRQGKVLQREIDRIHYVFGPPTSNSAEYGGWIFFPNLLHKDAVIYSVGLGADMTWDLHMMQQYRTVVHGFDGTPAHLAWYKQNKHLFDNKVFRRNFFHHPAVLVEKDGIIDMALPSQHSVSYSIQEANAIGFKQGTVTRVQGKSLETIMNELHHSHVDILKMDVEGAEYSVLSTFRKDQLVCQVLVEFHDRLVPNGVEARDKAVKHLIDLGFTPAVVSYSDSADPDGAVTFVHYENCCAIRPKPCRFVESFFSM